MRGTSTERAPADRTFAYAVSIAVFVALVLRLAFAFAYWVDKPLTLDEREYLLLATSIAKGEGFRYPPAAPGAESSASAVPERHFERPPVYAAVLAAVLAVTADPLVSSARDAQGRPAGFPSTSSDVPASIKIVQVVFGLLAVLLVAAIARQAAGTVAGIAAAFIAAIYPPLVWICGYVLAEPLYSALAFAVVWLLNPVTRRRSTDESYGRRNFAGPAGITFAAGMVAGVAVLTKEAMVFFVPLAAAWLLARRRLVPAAAFVLGLVIVLAPWVARNYSEHGRFVLTAAHGGVTFWTGNNPLSPGEGDLAANPGMGRARVEFERRHAGSSIEELDSAYYREAIGFIVSHPVEWLVLTAKKLFYTFVPVGPSYRLHSRRYFVMSLLSYCSLFPLAVAGVWTLVRRRVAANVWALWLLAISGVLMCLVFFPQERFRIPVFDPALVVAAAAWAGLHAPLARLFPAVDIDRIGPRAGVR